MEDKNLHPSAEELIAENISLKKEVSKLKEENESFKRIVRKFPQLEKHLSARHTSFERLHEERKISPRLFHCLDSAEILTVADLEDKWSQSSLLKIRNMGKKTLDELKDFMRTIDRPLKL